ncbi:MAG: hypothetical protein GF317_02845 [Candidatus Lokiarchaeota archaeon]|nr:hypothetical protein [Candidatus Lokiarchaeota archaeon]MBD3198844.1 hypothetical protein [Candidatus Lokiarchaeota archaeon]
MAHEEILCTSYFDTIIGPNTFYCSEPLSDDFDHPDLGRILEFNDEEGTFIFAFRKYQTINHIFYISSEYARGGQELVMISYMIRAAYFKKEITDVFKYLESKTSILENLASKLSQLREFSVILHSNKNGKLLKRNNLLGLGSTDFQKEFLRLFKSTFDELCLKEGRSLIENDEKLKKIFIFGADHVGKTTFLRNLEALQFKQQNNQELTTRILEVVIDNMEILTDKCYDNDFKCQQCEKQNRCINRAQGFILIFDVSDKNSIIDAKEHYKLIVNSICKGDQLNSVPILLVGNKFRYHEDVSPQFIHESFETQQTKECNIALEYITMNIREDNTKIMNSLKWIVKKILET